MKKCFGYTRVSTQKQGEGVSLEAQQEAITAFSERNDIEIIEWFEEKQTAAKSGRPIFNAMLRKLRQRKATGVVMHKVDRSARNAFDWARIGQLADRGVDVHFATESLDFRSRGGRLTADIQAVIAADYIRNLREETIKGMNGRLKQGLYPFNAPLGYLDNGGGQVKTPDPVRAPFIKELFSLYGSGQHSLMSLVKEMKECGLRNRSGNPLCLHGVASILDNPFYAGIIRVKTTGHVYEGIHEPLISASLFEKVQEIKAGRCTKKVTRHDHTFRGLFRCGFCEAAMIAERQRGHVYYRCHTLGCATKTVREEQIGEAIVDFLRVYALSDEEQTRLRERLEDWFCKRERVAKQDSPVKLQLAAVEQRLSRLTDALVDQLIDKADFNHRKQSLLLEKANLEETMKRLGKKAIDRSHTLRFLEQVMSLADNYISARAPQKREFVSWATSNRTVSGKNVYLEPQNWLRTVQMLAGVPAGDPPPHTDRSPQDFEDQQIIQLAEACRKIPKSDTPDTLH